MPIVPRRVLKLSVITPSLNQGEFIERTIRSVLDQAYPALEYLVVDGGSTDRTLEVIERYSDRIDWWISEPDEGQTDALAKGLERASGDVIAYINSDDYYLPGAFEAALATLESSGASWVAGAAINVDPEDRPTEEMGGVWVPQPPQAVESWPAGRQWWIIRNWSAPQPACFWRRGLFERHGGFRRDMHLAFDVDFMERIALAGELPALTDRRLAARVMHPGAKSFDTTKWDPEYRASREALRPLLSPRERRLLPVCSLINQVWDGKPAGPWTILRRIRHLLLKAGGDVLGLLPERIRPRVRTRDRAGS